MVTISLLYIRKVHATVYIYRGFWMQNSFDCESRVFANERFTKESILIQLTFSCNLRNEFMFLQWQSNPMYKVYAPLLSFRNTETHVSIQIIVYTYVLHFHDFNLVLCKRDELGECNNKTEPNVPRFIGCWRPVLLTLLLHLVISQEYSYNRLCISVRVMQVRHSKSTSAAWIFKSQFESLGCTYTTHVFYRPFQIPQSLLTWW